MASRNAASAASPYSHGTHVVVPPVIERDLHQDQTVGLRSATQLQQASVSQLAGHQAEEVRQDCAAEMTRKLSQTARTLRPKTTAMRCSPCPAETLRTSFPTLPR